MALFVDIFLNSFTAHRILWNTNFNFIAQKSRVSKGNLFDFCKIMSFTSTVPN